MKRLVCALSGLLLSVGLLAGCGTSLEADASLVYVDKKGGVISLDVEELGQAYYDEEELEEFVKEHVDAYTAEHGRSSVKLEKIAVEDGTAKMQMSYGTAADYAGFNGIELYQGKVVSSLADGYTYDGDFAKVESGKVTGAATKQEIYGDEELKVVIIRANTDVKIEGEICYVSCENVKLTGVDTVSIREGYFLDNGTADVQAVPPAGAESLSGTESLSGAEGLTEGTEAPGDTGAQSMDEGSFETDVYTFIVYK